jgi:hypothetical protein
MVVDHDAFVTGAISGNMTVKGTLHHPVPVASPCNCDPIPVAALVTGHKTNNDNNNVTPPLDPNLFTGAGPARVDLPCGNFYLTGITRSGTIVAHGRTGLFIDGNINVNGFELTVDPTGELDIFVNGAVLSTGSFTLGSANWPALTRMYIGTSGTFDIQSGLIIGANIWAGNANVLWESTSDMFGTLVAGDLDLVADFRAHQDNAILSAGDTCPKPPPPGGGGDAGAGTDGGGSTGDGGIPPTPCTSCKDCGNQACSSDGVCGSCSTSGQCCPPLVCIGGTCRLSP